MQAGTAEIKVSIVEIAVVPSTCYIFYDTTGIAGRMAEPVLWTRIFSICFLTLISYWKRHQRMKRLDTLIATTGIASAITSSYSLIVILFGIIVYSERLTRNQVVGISVFMAGLVLLALIK